MTDLFAQKRGRALAEERYPEPAHGPAKALRRIAVDAFTDGYVSRAEAEPEDQDLWDKLAEMVLEEDMPEAAAFIKDQRNADTIYEKYLAPLLDQIRRDFYG